MLLNALFVASDPIHKMGNQNIGYLLLLAHGCKDLVSITQ
jgi:hypothetical protein